MTLTWSDASELVLGLVLDGRIAKSAVRPEIFIPPYNKIIEEIQQNPTIEIEDLIERHGFSPIRTAWDAVHGLNGLGEKNWIKILEETALYYDAGRKLEKFGQRLQTGEPVDWGQIAYYSRLAQQGQGGDFTSLDKVQKKSSPFILTGWSPWDDHLLGIPAIGTIIVGASSYAGKTTLAVKLASCFAKVHIDKIVGFFTLEMAEAELQERFEGVASDLSEEEKSRILLNEHPVSAEQVISKAAGIEHLGLVIVDYVDYLIKGEITSSAMESVYKTLALGSKELGCPIIILAQLSNYTGGIPRPYHLRWTRIAEASAWEIVMIFNPNGDWFEDDEAKNAGLKMKTDTAYLCCWKVKGGFRKHLEDSPGAIAVPYRPDRGWGDKSRWFSLKKFS